MNKLSLAALPLLASSLLAQGVHEAQEPNDTTSTATLLPLGEQGVGDITASDEDWFRVTLAADSDYKIWTSPGFAGQIEDTRVRIMAADGTTQIVDVDDGNTSTHGYYTTMQGALVAGVYYVAVRGYNSSTVGSYTLDVVLAQPGTYVGGSTPTGAASVTVQAGGCAGSNGTPLLDVAETSGFQSGRRPEVPVLGSTYYVTGSSLPPSSLLFRVIGLLPRATPFNLGFFGAPGCQIEVDPIDQIPSLSDTGGLHYWGIASPADVAFIGLPIEQQLIAIDLGNNSLGVTVSNRLSSVFGVTH